MKGGKRGKGTGDTAGESSGESSSHSMWGCLGAGRLGLRSCGEPDPTGDLGLGGGRSVGPLLTIFPLPPPAPWGRGKWRQSAREAPAPIQSDEHGGRRGAVPGAPEVPHIPGAAQHHWGGEGGMAHGPTAASGWMKDHRPGPIPRAAPKTHSGCDSNARSDGVRRHSGSCEICVSTAVKKKSWIG